MRCREQLWLWLWLWAFAAPLVSACPSEPVDPPPSGPLVQAGDWERVTDPGLDHFAAMRPPEAECADEGWYVDPFRGSLEIKTDLCDYLTLRQSSRLPLAAGDTITITGFHDQLTAPEPAQGYLGLTIDGELVWEYTTVIPSDVDDIEESFTVDVSAPVGSELQLHVHNHGPNTWEIIAVVVDPAI